MFGVSPDDRPHAQLLAVDHAHARVFADDRYADWLLWSEPQLRGRVAYDVRFELFRPRQFLDLYKYRNRIGDDWRDAAKGYDLIAFDPQLQDSIRKGMIKGGLTQVYRDAALVVLTRPHGLRRDAARQLSAACGSEPMIERAAAGAAG